MSIRAFVGAALLIVVLRGPARADPAASFMAQLFSEVCLANQGRPDQVRRWVEAHKLARIVRPEAMKLFVGPGDRGGAWADPVAAGAFAISLRGMGQGCSVWVQRADAASVRGEFERLMATVKAQGGSLTIERDSADLGADGESHTQIYDADTKNVLVGYRYSMLAKEAMTEGFQAYFRVEEHMNGSVVGPAKVANAARAPAIVDETLGYTVRSPVLWAPFRVLFGGEAAR